MELSDSKIITKMYERKLGSVNSIEDNLAVVERFSKEIP